MFYGQYFVVLFCSISSFALGLLLGAICCKSKQRKQSHSPEDGDRHAWVSAPMHPVTQPKITTFFLPEKLPCHNYVNALSKREDRCFCKNKTTTLVHPDQKKSCLARIMTDLASAKTVELCIYRFTLKMVADLLINLHKQNTKIRIVSDSGRLSKKPGQETKNDQIPYLLENGIEVREEPYNASADKPALMHDKFVIIDGQILYTGSLNWTYQAVTKNQESVLRIVDSGTIRDFRNKFNYCWASLESATR